MKLYYEIISRRRNGVTITLCRFGLFVLSLFYGLGVCFRNFLYEKKIKKIYRFDVPVISVGNLTLGGTGKTPVVAYLAHYFSGQGKKPGIISRGYGKNSLGINDEFQELALRCPNVPHIQNKDRIAAVKDILHRNAPDVIILDDAFQHRRLARSLNIVLLDAAAPFGYGSLFPRGTLREPVGGLRRADVVLLSRADLIDEKERNTIKEKVFQTAPGIIWGEIIHKPEKLIHLDGKTAETESLRGKTALAFCGIGNPAAFRKTLEQCGVNVLEWTEFPDHHHYTAADLQRLEKKAEMLKPDTVLCTMKDLVKIEKTVLPICAVSIGIQFLNGEDVFLQTIGGRVN
ncbi:tetraacyldisaccharide 4'-kinase [Planctomycetales bacterium]|nr:tetraacyldisaccharide 4'-kinase [Planctomycetales bacterium]